MEVGLKSTRLYSSSESKPGFSHPQTSVSSESQKGQKHRMRSEKCRYLPGKSITYGYCGEYHVLAACHADASVDHRMY
jgi:hypothetical protein